MSDGSKGAAGGLNADVVRRLLARAALFFGLGLPMQTPHTPARQGTRQERGAHAGRDV